MFTTKKPANPELDAVITQLYSELVGYDSNSDEYDRITTQLSKLLKLKHEVEPTTSVSPDTLATIIGNLIGIAAILHYEKVHVVTSKALAFAGKLR